jgi:hypothetical protein
MDAHDIVDDIYRHAEKLMHESGTEMQPDYVGKPEDLYLWCLIRQSKTCWEYACPMHYSCGWDTGMRITETKQTRKLEMIGVHDRHSHIGPGARCMLASPRLKLVFLAQRAKDLQMMNLVGGVTFFFLFHHRSDITVSS